MAAINGDGIEECNYLENGENMFFSGHPVYRASGKSINQYGQMDRKKIYTK